MLVPCAFLCHTGKDKPLALRIGRDFLNQGIETFVDTWEISPGDSLRQKIDAGLTRCTHFVALMSPSSIDKPWVNAEMDAAFIRKVEGACKFIPLRVNLQAEQLPPLLRGVHSPELREGAYEEDMRALVGAIHGLSEKPPLGFAPRAVLEANQRTGLSPAAESIARMMIERSEYGDTHDPNLDEASLKAATEMADDDIIDAIDELERYGLVGKITTLGCGPLGFAYVHPKSPMFWTLDEFYKPWNPRQDALRIAAELVNGTDNDSIPKMAEKLGWPPRRMNPAVNFLVDHGYVRGSQESGTHPWTTYWVQKIPETRRFLRDNP